MILNSKLIDKGNKGDLKWIYKIDFIYYGHNSFEDIEQFVTKFVTLEPEILNQTRLVVGTYILDLFNFFNELGQHIQSADVSLEFEFLQRVFGQIFFLRIRNPVDLREKVRYYLVLNATQREDMFVIAGEGVRIRIFFYYFQHLI
jgi:hypothetical protein